MIYFPWVHMAGEWKTRLGNAAVTPVRMGLWAPWYAAIDLAKTGNSLYQDSYNIVRNTIDDIQEIFQEAGKRGKWYHKAFNLPWAWVVGSAKVVEWTVRSVVNPLVNGVVNTFNTAKWFIKNERRWLTSVFSKKPVSDFSFEHLQTRSIWKNRNFTKALIGWGAAATAATVASQAPQSTPVVPMAAPVATMDEASQKTIADLTAKVAQQDETNKQLQQNMLAIQEQMKQQTAMIQQSLQQNNDLVKTLQSQWSDNKQEVDSQDESPKKKSLKHKQAA